MCADVDSAEILSLVARSGFPDRCLKHVVNPAHRDAAIEHVAEQLHHAPERTVADQRRLRIGWRNHALDSRQLEEHLLVVAVPRRRGGLEGLFGLGRLPVDELAADRVPSGQTADRFGLPSKNWLLSEKVTSLGETGFFFKPNSPPPIPTFCYPSLNLGRALPSGVFDV